MRPLSVLILFLLYSTICENTDPNITASVTIDNNGKMSEFATNEIKNEPNEISNEPSMDNTYNRMI